MTIERIDPATGEVIELPTRAEAERLTERIRLALDRVSTSWADLGERIAEAYQKRVDLALGYDSWADYAEAELKPASGIAADVRRQLVSMLSAQGMSTRAIAPTVGVTHKTVVIDRQVVHPVPPAPQSPTIEPVERPSLSAVDVAEHGTHAPAASRPVVGLDGKTYTRPAPSAPKRRPLPDQFADAVHDLERRIEALERLVADDRLPQNRNKVAARNHSDLVRAIDALQRVASSISPTTKEN